jgi:hypothetical protein
MKLRLTTHPPDREEHKCLVLGFFSDERPPRGPCGLVDWRLNGLISREIRQAHIGGALQEKVVIPKPERINTEMLILFGGGPVTDLSYNRVYDAAYEMANTVDSLKLSDFSFDLPGEGRVLLSSSGMFEAMVAGFFDFLSGDVSKLEAMNICLVTAKERLPEIADGIARFNKNIRHHGAVDFSRMESYLAELS